MAEEHKLYSKKRCKVDGDIFSIINKAIKFRIYINKFYKLEKIRSEQLSKVMHMKFRQYDRKSKICI